MPGVTEEGQIDEGEPVVFVRHISTWPEKWFDLPLFTSERHADGNSYCFFTGVHFEISINFTKISRWNAVPVVYR